MIPLRRFNEAGLHELNDAMDRVDAGEVVDFAPLVTDVALTEVLVNDPVVAVREFKNRRDAGAYLYELLSPHQVRIGDIERDRGLWAWLATAWIDLLAPATPSGTRNLKARARWIPMVHDYQKYYRHLLAGPYRIYRTHRDNPDRAMAVLATSVLRPGEVVEQFASRQGFITNPNLMEAVTALYFDATRGVLKQGAGGKGAGSARRLADVLQQFDMTWDIFGMSKDEIIELLPGEFSSFATN